MGAFEDDEFAGPDMQADVFETMKDVSKVNEHPGSTEESVALTGDGLISPEAEETPRVQDVASRPGNAVW